MHRIMAYLWVHTLNIGSFVSFCPTINLFVDFLHRLSLERTGDAAPEATGNGDAGF